MNKQNDVIRGYDEEIAALQAKMDELKTKRDKALNEVNEHLMPMFQEQAKLMNRKNERLLQLNEQRVGLETELTSLKETQGQATKTWFTNTPSNTVRLQTFNRCKRR